MAKKKSKKSQKPVEPSDPPDNVPANSEDLVADAPGALLQDEPSAAEATSGEQSVQPASEVETEGTIPKSAEMPISASSQHGDSLDTIPDEVAASSPVNDASTAQLDPPMEQDPETDSQPEPIHVTEPGAALQTSEDTPAVTDEVEEALTTTADDTVEPAIAPEEEQHVIEEDESTQPSEQVVATLVLDTESDIAQEPTMSESLAVPTEDPASTSEPAATEAEPEAPAEDATDMVEEIAAPEEPMEASPSEEPIEPEPESEPQPEEESAVPTTTEAVEDDIAPESLPAEPTEVVDEAVDDAPTEETLVLPSEEPESSEVPPTEAEASTLLEPEDAPEDIPEDALEDAPEDAPEDTPEDTPEDATEDNPEDTPEDAPEDNPEDDPSLPPVLEAPFLDSEPVPEAEPVEVETEPVMEPAAPPDEDEPGTTDEAQEAAEAEAEAAAAAVAATAEAEAEATAAAEAEALEHERLEQQKLEDDARIAAEEAEAAATAEAEAQEHERLEQQKLEDDARIAAEAEVQRQELERVERERLEAEAKDLLERERLEAIEAQDAEARELLEKSEQERLAREAQEEIEANEAAEAAERAQDEIRAKEEEEHKESERLEQERIARERVEQERQEQIAEARKLLQQMEQERREEEAREEQAREEMEAAAIADRARRAAEQLDRERFNRGQLHHDQTEHDRLEMEARDADEHTQRAADQDEAARSAAEEPRWRHASHEEEAPQVPQASARARQPLAESPARGSSPSSAVPGMHDRSPTSATFDPPFRSYRSAAPHAPKLRRQEAGPNHVPKPYAVSQLIEDNRPPAPSPPMSRVRPRHVPTFDSDDDSDSVLVQSRIASRRPFSGEAHEVSRAHLGPHQPRSGFASRVPVEPAYPAPPPNYHPSYYAPPSQPPHYPNHGYGMSQQGYPAPNPNPYGPSSHSSSSPYQEPWSQYPPGYPPYGSPPRRQDSSGSRDYPLHAPDGRPAIEDGSGDVFSRIAATIPDLHVLLARYKETHSQLSVREDLLRRAGAEQEEKLRAKDGEIAELKAKIYDLENRNSAEAHRLHLQIGNLEEQVKELREQLADTRKFKREAEETKLVLDAAMKSWEARYKELEDVHRTLERTTAEERARAWRDFDEWKATTNTKHDAEKIALAIQFDKKLKQAESAAEQAREEAAEAAELKAELEDALRREQELIQERDSLQQDWEEQRNLLDSKYQQTRDDAIRKAEEESARADRLAEEKEELLQQYDQLKAESQREKEIIKSVASNLESEKSRLEKMMECYGDIAEIKSKGDNYYLVSFAQLQNQIIDLATAHFVHLPVRPPVDDLAQVPSNLPSFLGDTIASRQVRVAYVVHTVSKLITYRVFGPFLFSLGRRYDKADSLFTSMSHHIRDKSTRKEAIWRQQTLLAAFTSSGAKQRINTAAGTVVEEIVNAIKHFADPKEEEGIKISVKRIVKLAAETWRFARLEREMIIAAMPALQDEEHQFTSNEYWPAYTPEGTADVELPDGQQPQLLLRMFPVIYRDAKHENFQNNGESDEGCVFHHGLALYSDAEPVVKRMEELKSAGLPSHTTALTSPTDEGKFPPPACPPPRDAPPSPPVPPSPRSPTKTETNMDEKGPEKSSRIKRASLPFSNHSPGGKSDFTPPSAYTRPVAPPTSVFTSPRNFIGMPVESLAPSQAPTARRKGPPLPPKPSSKPEIPLPAATWVEALRHQTSTESAILPPSFSRTTTQDTVQDADANSSSGPPTPTDAVTEVFDAIDDIESLLPQRTQTTPISHSRRRSTHSRRFVDHPIEEDIPERPESARRKSYAASVRTHKSADTERTDKSDRTSRTEKSDRSDKTEQRSTLDKARYLWESRGAAMKALYPNSPFAGQSTNGSTKNSSKSERSERGERSERRKDRSNTTSSRESRESRESKRESRELKRQKSFPDNATWDTNSVITNEDFAPTTISTNVPYPSAQHSRRDSKEVKRESKDLRRQPSISVAGTWDTASEVTHRAPPTTVSTNVPYPMEHPEEFPWELRHLRRERSIPDDGTWIADNATWDTSSEITQRGPATTVSTNVPYSTERPREARRMSISDAGTWDTDSEVTTAHRAPPTTVSTNVPYPSQLPRQLRRLSVSDAGTWDTASEVTHHAPLTTVSTNVPYPTELPRQIRRLRSVSDAGTWDTSSEVTHRPPPTTVSTNVPYPGGHVEKGPFERLRMENSYSDDGGSDSGTWDTSSEITHANNGPATTVSTNVPYQTERPAKPEKPERPKSLRRKTSPPVSVAGTWDTASIITTNDDMKTSVSTNVPYPADRRFR